MALTIPSDACCAAFVLLYPTTTAAAATTNPASSNYHTMNNNTAAEVILEPSSTNNNEIIVFLKQVVGGTCGLLAAVHAIANSPSCYDAISNNSILSTLIKDTSILCKSKTDLLEQSSRRFVQSKTVRRAHLRVNQPSWTVLRRTRNTICSRFCI